MTDIEDPVLFDVSAIVLGLAGTPVSDNALRYIQDAVKGRIEAIIPHTAIVGSHLVLRKRYGYDSEDATYVLSNLLDANRITWYRRISHDQTLGSLQTAEQNAVGAWDGYYAEIAKESGATVLTMDRDFIDELDVEASVLLDDEEFRILNEYMQDQGLI